jgi:predicted ATPase
MTAPIARLQGRIQRVSIEGFRSLAKIEDLALPQLTVLIGANGAGKSNFIRFFEMLSWMLKSQKLQEFVQHHGWGDDQFYMGARRTPRIQAELRIETRTGFNDYSFGLAHLSASDTVLLMDEAYRYSYKDSDSAVRWTRLDGGTKESTLPEQNNPTARTIVHLLRQCATYQFHDTSANASIRNGWDVTASARLRSDGGNLAAVLLDLHENALPRYKQIVRQIQRVLPPFDDFVLEPVAGKVLLRWKGRFGDKTFGAHLTSDGSLRLFCLLTLLNLPDDRLPDVLFLDEPELGLHPHAINLVAEMVKRVAHTRQVFLATQSPYMVDCFELENVIVADVRDGATSLRTLPRERYQEWLDNEYSVSDLWLKTPVGAAP